MSPQASARPAPSGSQLRRLTLAALGVVYGDIGTSPLYALRECFHGEHAMAATPENVLGILSLVFWSLLVVVSLKYLVFVLRADNRGEGGILALTALATAGRGGSAATPRLALLGLLGAALLYGDSMITPAISVLSAVEGLEVATPFFSAWVIPITLVLLVLLFLFQRRGTARIGAVFGPITLLWFVVLAALGIAGIAREPAVLRAVDPLRALAFFVDHGLSGFVVLASVILVVTGSEALYADMGHFGRRPIRVAWFTVVLPALLLNYFGQGALLLEQPDAAQSLFYRMAPGWALYPLVALATAATVIASQAVISGAYSVTRQAIQLGYSPRLRVDHTSAEEIGQIYMGPVNWALAAASCALVLGFGSSSGLAGAYGMAAATTMFITTPMLGVVARRRWGWGASAFVLTAGFLLIDGAFLGANLSKLTHGGWFPLIVGAGLFMVMATWKRGRRVLQERLRAASLPVDLFLEDVRVNPLPRVSGSAVFLTGDPEGTPHALLHNIKHNKVLHEQVLFLSVLVAEVPYVPGAERVTVKELGAGFFRVRVSYGFMQDPNVPAALAQAREDGFAIDLERTSYFLGREKLIPSRRSGMARWREVLFAFLSDNAQSATTFFRIPPGRVVELGAQLEI